jgi:hypothetical protein
MITTPKTALAALLRSEGLSEDTANGVARTICNLDEAELLAAIKGRAVSTLDGEMFPSAVCALEAKPPEAPSFDIEGVMLSREVALLISQSGAGKTTASIAIAGCTAGGYDLFDSPAFKVNASGPVLFVSEEDGLGFLLNRFEALVAGHGWDRERVQSKLHFLVQEGVSLDDSQWRTHILAEIERIGAVLVVFDPYAELTQAAENSNDEAKPNVRFFREITKAGASVLVNHHIGKLVEGRSKQDLIRGASALGAAARGIFLLGATDIGISLECIKMSRSERLPKFVVKREIESDPANRAMWKSARLTYLTQTDADHQAAERFVIEQLTRRGTLNTTQLKAFAKGTGVNSVAVSKAIKDLGAVEKIGYEKGPNNSRMWRILPVAQNPRQPRQPDLPACPEVARQIEEASTVVAPTCSRATGAGAGDRSGNPTADILAQETA